LRAFYFSSSRSRLTVAGSVLKKPLTIFSSSSPAAGSISKFSFFGFGDKIRILQGRGHSSQRFIDVNKWAYCSDKVSFTRKR